MALPLEWVRLLRSSPQCAQLLVLGSSACLILLGSCQLDSTQADKPSLPSPSRLPPEAVPSPEIGVIFTDVTEASGLQFTHSFGDGKFSNLVEAVGGGVAFLDYDRDGWLDIYLTSGKWDDRVSQGPKPAGNPSNRLYHNLQNGTFQDVTKRAGLAASEHSSMGIAVGDYDNDGFPDLYVCNYGRSQLFRNSGAGIFEDVTDTAGVANQALCSVAATWLDFDRDGLLDLYVTAYIDYDPNYTLYYSPDGFPGPLSYKGQPDRLYRNLGDSRFEDVSQAMGIEGLEGRGMSVASIDYNSDGYTDLYVTNDGTENFLLQNLEGRGFRQIALETGVGYNGMGDSTASMGVDFGDFDGDGLMDLFVSDNSLSSLYRNEGDGLFLDTVVEAGVALSSAQFVGWGSFFFDFDNDSDLDILKVNSDLSRLFGQEDQVFSNRGNGTFEDVSSKLGDYFQRTLLGRGAAYADYDNDGDLDIVVSNIDGPAVLLRNDGGSQRNWLALDLVGTRSNRDALGSRVTVHTAEGSQTAYRLASRGYLSASDSRIHFGLGTVDSVQRIEIAWTSGKLQVLENIKVNQVIHVEEPTD